MARKKREFDTVRNLLALAGGMWNKESFFWWNFWLDLLNTIEDKFIFWNTSRYILYIGRKYKTLTLCLVITDPVRSVGLKDWTFSACKRQNYNNKW